MKAKKILLSILALMLFIQVIPAEAYSIIKEEIGSGHGHISLSGYEYYSRIFYSNYTKHFYAIFGMIGPGAISYSVYYSYSPDGINWAQSDRTLHPISFPGSVNADGVNKKIDFYMTPDGKHIYYVHEDEYDATELRWGKVSLNLTTSRLMNNISSTTILDGVYGGGPPLDYIFGTKVIDDSYSITVDEDGYVFIGAEFYWSSQQYGYIVIKSNSPDHFNYEDFGDAWLIELEFINDGSPNLPNDAWHGRIIPVLGGEDIVWVGSYYQNFGVHEIHLSTWYDQSADDWASIAGGLFNDQEGGDWRDEQWDLGWSSDLAVFFKQDESKHTPERIEIDAKFLNEATRTWENQTDISFEELGDGGSVNFLPLVSVREGTNAVNFAWSIAGNDTIWERRMFPNGTLEDIRILESFEDDYFTIPGNKFFNDPNGQGPSPLMWFVDGGQIEKWWWAGNGDYILGNYSLFLEADGEEEDWEPIYSHTSTKLYNADGTEVTDNWLFEGEVYDLVSIVNNLTSFDVQMYDTRHNVTFRWNNATEQQWIDVTPYDQFTAGLPWSNFTRNGDQTTIRWRFILDRSIVDCINQTWMFFMENSDYGPGFWGSPGIETNIYNLGGFTYYNFTGDGGRTAGGQPFEIYATNGTDGSFARAEQFYRKLQSVHFLIEIDMDNEWDAGAGAFDIDPGIGWIDIGFDYRMNGTWVEGIYAKIYVQSANVGHHNAGNDHDWIEWSVDWYAYNPGSGTWTNKRSQLIYSNHWGYDNENLSPAYHNRTSGQLWIDLWFDRTNSSSTIGGQVNAMYHGMREHGSSWWFGYGDFQPMISDYGNAQFLDSVYDEEGNVTDSMAVDLIRVFVEVGKVADAADGDDETWTIRAVENYNRKQADDRMQGVEMPAFEPTLVLDMPMFQSMNPLIRAIDGISIAIWKGALGFQKILWGAFDSFFAWAGFGEGFFSQITAFIMLIPQVFSSILQNLGMAITYLVTMIDDTFSMFMAMLPEFVLGLGWLADSILSYWRILNDLLNGGLMPFNIIQELGMGVWIRFLFSLLPMFEIMGVLFSNNPGQRLKERVGFYSGLFNGAINFIKGFILFMQNAVSTIMEILPG